MYMLLTVLLECFIKVIVLLEYFEGKDSQQNYKSLPGIMPNAFRCRYYYQYNLAGHILRGAQQITVMKMRFLKAYP